MNSMLTRVMYLLFTAAPALAQASEGSWTPLGSGMNDLVSALTVLPDGSLVAGGRFSSAGGVPASAIAHWDGSAWSALGAFDNEVKALLTLSNGDLIAGGEFGLVNDREIQAIARWDGMDWSPIGAGIGGYVGALAQLSNGDLVAGGTFGTAGGVQAHRIARWDGIAWNPLGSGLPGHVYTLAVLPDGDLIAGGYSFIARWDGQDWHSLGGEINGPVQSLAVLHDGQLIAGGHFDSASGVPGTTGIARWDGQAWHSLGGGPGGSHSPRILALTVLPNGDLIAGGIMDGSEGAGHGIARWDGDSWSAIGSITNGVFALTTLPDGDFVAGGSFVTADEMLVNRIARWCSSDELCASCPGGSVSGPNFLKITSPECSGAQGTYSVASTGVLTDGTWSVSYNSGGPPLPGLTVTLTQTEGASTTVSFTADSQEFSSAFNMKINWTGYCNGLFASWSQPVQCTVDSDCTSYEPFRSPSCWATAGDGPPDWGQAPGALLYLGILLLGLSVIARRPARSRTA